MGIGHEVVPIPVRQDCRLRDHRRDHAHRGQRQPVRELHEDAEYQHPEPRQAAGARDPAHVLRGRRQLPRARHRDGPAPRREARVPAGRRRGLPRQQRAGGDRRTDRDPEGRDRSGAVRRRAGRGDRQALQEGVGGAGARLRLRLHARQRRQRAHVAARRPYVLARQEHRHLQADGALDRHRAQPRRPARHDPTERQGDVHLRREGRHLRRAPVHQPHEPVPDALPGRRAVDGQRGGHREHEGRRRRRGGGAGDRRAAQPGGERALSADRVFPIVRRPSPEARTPVLVSVPHFGTEPLPHITRDHYREPWFETFAYGFADTFVGDLYGDLHEHGATVLATPFSRMFVDVNRRRDDFDHQDGEVRSRRGVVRTHTMREAPIFRDPLGLADLEARLQALYDPYYSVLDTLLGELSQRYGYALLLDGHTGSPRRMKDHQVIIGTRHEATCAFELVETVAAIFTRHGFEVHRNISGYTGGNIVATYGHPSTRGVHALQLEINASLLMTTSREEFIAHITRGGIPDKHEANIARVRCCLQEVLAVLPAVLATV